MKKNEELLHSIGDVEDKYIESARPKKIQKRKVVWISAVSAAACLVASIGLVYYFVIRPISDINNNGNDPTKIITTTAVTKTTEPPQTGEDKVIYPDVKTIELHSSDSRTEEGFFDTGTSIKQMVCDDENIIIQKTTDSDIETWYLSVIISSLDKKIYLPAINNISYNDIYPVAGNHPDACYNDNNLYIMMGGTLYSVSINNNEIIAHKDSFSSNPYSDSYDCLGVDNDGNVYIRWKGFDSQGVTNESRIIKYSPELIQISEYSTNNAIEFDRIINFSDMYIDSDDVLYCKYDENKTVRIDLSDQSISCDEEIIKEDEYWHVKNESGQKPLSTYTRSNDQEKRSKAWMQGAINCIDSYITLSVESTEKASYIQMDKSGNIIKEHDLPGQFDFISDGLILDKNKQIVNFVYSNSGFSDDTATNDIIAYDMDSEKTNVKTVKNNKFYELSGTINPVDFNMNDSGYYYLVYNALSETVKKQFTAFESVESALISRYDRNDLDGLLTIKLKKEDIYDFYEPKILINDNNPYVINRYQYREDSVIYKPDFENKSYSKTSDIPGKLYPQSDGTVLCILKGTLYTYSIDSGKMTKIFDLPQEVVSSKESLSDIQKIDQSSYACLTGAMTSQTYLYILTL